jgi:hypothetical protein
MRLDDSGRLLVGTSSARTVAVYAAGGSQLQVEGTTYQSSSLSLINNQAGTDSSYFVFGKSRGTSTGSVTLVNNNDLLGATLWFTGADGTSLIRGAVIEARVDGTPGTNDMPGRLVFSTTADGASSPTERMRIDSAGNVGINTTAPGALLHAAGKIRFGNNASYYGEIDHDAGSTGANIYDHSDSGGHIFRKNGAEHLRIDAGGNLLVGKTATGLGTVGHTFAPDGTVYHTGSAQPSLFVNRLTSDGELVRFYQDNTQEGSISVSGTTVSYNGAHLSRWSQIPGIDPYNKAVRPEILRGTVMSNLDEMCDWTCPESGECQDNEQLNKTKISDVEGDKNVAGIFQAWDDDDDTWVNDYYLAMTGDFVIRIGAGTTVERGDLLMSAGDGTAKPQDDDIIRSKTIAKVTSTNVSCTYDDGSYCVPCVLMAC